MSSSKRSKLPPKVKPADPSSLRWRAVAASVFGVAAVVAYPLLVFYGLAHSGPRTVALVLLVALIPSVVVRLAKAPRDQWRQVAFVPLVVMGLVAASAILNRAGLILMVPVVINAVLAVSFGATLRTPTPMIERFARLENPDLTPAEVRWCRLWTKIWVGFFVVNVVIVTALVSADWRSWWMYYTGLIAYLEMGVLFATEYIFRKARFGRLGQHPPDRALGWLLRRLGWLSAEAEEAQAP